MISKLRLWWQKIKKHPVRSAAVLVAGMLGIALLVIFVLGYWLNWSWTGLGPYTSPPHPTDSDFQRGRTLWDWLQLLIIPVVLAIGGFWLNQMQKSRELKTTEQQAFLERELTHDNQQETLLQAYIDKMSELLLEKKLRDSKPEDEVRKIARVRTLTVLPRLDADRKRSVLQFLYEADLIHKDKCIVELRGADLGYTNLSQADLHDAYLSQADLHDADLSNAYLGQVNLQTAVLRKAILRRTNLSGANLIGTDLSEANLQEAYLGSAVVWGDKPYRVELRGANLSGANLKGVTGITLEELDRANSLKGTIMPDGTKHS